MLNEYNTLLGREIWAMQTKVLSEHAPRVVKCFLEAFKEFHRGGGIEAFECIIGDYVEGSEEDKRLYDSLVALEDMGPEWCANEVGIKIKRKVTTDARVSFARRIARGLDIVGEAERTLRGMR